MILAAGILFEAADGRVLLLRRSAEGDHAGEWSLPGGKIEDGETAEQAAIREVGEEIGVRVGAIDGASSTHLFARRQRDGVDWTTFRIRVPEPFAVELNDEHDESAWVQPGEPPAPMHPGAQVVLDRLGMDELGVARAIRDGDLTSPQRYEKMALVAMRITGTGVAYRAGLREYVWRDPDLYLTPEFLARCAGLPVVVEHPKGSTLDSDEFADRVVGTIMLPYVKQNEVWGISKVFDASTIEMIETHKLSTSPSVVFRDPSVNETETLDDGSTLLIEGKPSLLDHLAICEQGVWDKGGEPTGIAATITNGGTTVDNDGDDKKEATAAADADTDAGQKLDKILAHMDSMSARMDALESGAAVKPEEKAADAASGGGSGTAPNTDEYPAEIASMPEETAQDKFRKDAACAGYKADQKAKADAAAAEGAAREKAVADAARRDTELAETRTRVADLEGKVGKEPAGDDGGAMADEQAKADSVYQQHGAAAPRPLIGEGLLGYRRRLAKGMQSHSAAWKAIDLTELPSAALGVAVASIYADAIQAARNPVDLPEGTLREVVTTDATGRRITSFLGKPDAWMAQFGQTRRRVASISNGSR